MHGRYESLTKQSDGIYRALLENDYFNYFYEAFRDIVMNMFKWEGIPDDSDEYFMERALFETGKMCFYRDPTNNGIYSLRLSAAGAIDMYGYPIKYQITSANAGVFDKIVDRDDVVVCYNNKLRKSSMDLLFTPCVRMANIAMTIDTNVNAMKTPIIVEGDEYSINSLKQMYADYVRNQPVLFARKGKSNMMNQDALKAHNTGVEFYADKLLMLQHDMENDLLTRLGVNNTNIQKKERLVTNEVDSNLMEIMSHAYSLLDERVKFCEEVNKKYGLSMSVEFRNKKEIDDLLASNENIEYDPNDEEGESYE